MSLTRNVAVGALAGAAGTAAMDYLVYRRYRRDDGKDPLLRWEPPAAPDEWRGLGLWRAGDLAVVRAAVESLPLYDWSTVEITPLSPHPNDPAMVRS